MTINLPTGKGMYIWQISQCEGGDPVSIAQAARTAGLGHVLIKLADGSYPYQIGADGQLLDMTPYVEALQDKGVEVWGWGYAYGYDPIGEAAIAARYVLTLGLAGWVIDAEKEYKGRRDAARRLVSELRQRLPSASIGLSSYRYPSLHPEFPWAELRSGCDFDAPQVYWEQAHNPAAQLARCVREFASFKRRLPLIPTGAAYKCDGWSSTPTDAGEYILACEGLGLPAYNWWSWQHAHQIDGMWDAITGAAPVETWRVRITALLGLRVRMGPGTGYARVRTLPRGSVAVVSNRLGGWLALADGTGWISEDWTVRA